MSTEAQTCAIGILANRPNAIRCTLRETRATNYEPLFTNYDPRNPIPEACPLNPDHWSIMQNKPNFQWPE